MLRVHLERAFTCRRIRRALSDRIRNSRLLVGRETTRVHEREGQGEKVKGERIIFHERSCAPRNSLHSFLTFDRFEIGADLTYVSSLLLAGRCVVRARARTIVFTSRIIIAFHVRKIYCRVAETSAINFTLVLSFYLDSSCTTRYKYVK